MTRWKLTLEYDGGPFVGWQRQDNGLSVQQVLEEAIAKITGAPCPTITAGRTDAGVHACGQVVHFDTETPRTARAMRDGITHHLRPHPVVILTAEEVPDTFSARTSAIERKYLYRILNRLQPPALDRGRVWHLSAPLDVSAMHTAAQELVGRHDFTTFRAAACQAKSPVRTLDELTVTRAAEEVHIHARARSFLHHQVRNMVGTLALVGQGKWTTAHVRAALQACDRTQGGPTAPPDGLYFLSVRY